MRSYLISLIGLTFILGLVSTSTIAQAPQISLETGFAFAYGNTTITWQDAITTVSIVILNDRIVLDSNKRFSAIPSSGTLNVTMLLWNPETTEGISFRYSVIYTAGGTVTFTLGGLPSELYQVYVDGITFDIFESSNPTFTWNESWSGDSPTFIIQPLQIITEETLFTVVTFVAGLILFIFVIVIGFWQKSGALIFVASIFGVLFGLWVMFSIYWVFGFGFMGISLLFSYIGWVNIEVLRETNI